MVLVDVLATALQLYPVPHPAVSVHAAVHFLPPEALTHRLPGPSQSAFAVQDLPKLAVFANGTSFGLSSMPCIPYIVVKPHDSESSLVRRVETGCGRRRLVVSRASSAEMKSSTAAGVDAFEN